MLNETGEAIDARTRVVERARREVGDQNPDRYYTLVAHEFEGHAHDKAWCGVFALWCYVSEGLCSWVWSVEVHAPGFAWRLPRTTEPKPGDLAVFEKNPRTGATLWHHAIVERVEGDEVHTIDGNALPFPREGVAHATHPIDENVRFYSVEPLISDPPTRPDATAVRA